MSTSLRKKIHRHLAEIEAKVRQDLDFDKKRSSIKELHQSVPESLKTRLLKANVLPNVDQLFHEDNYFEVDETKMKVIEPDLQTEIIRRLPTLDQILEEQDISVDETLNLMSRAFQEVKLRVDSPEQKQELQQRNSQKRVNWIAEYVKKLRRHRVQWDSKLYRDNAAKDWHKKSMIENVEAMIDLSAVEFSEWCNSLASEEDSKNVSPELIKQLFSIGTEGSAPRGVHVEPQDLHILPPGLIQHFNKTTSNPSLTSGPMDLEWKMDKLRHKDGQENRKAEREFAFGRSLPWELKQKRRNRGLSKVLRPVFPEDLRSQEVLFKGIEHLKVTQSIFEHIGRGKEFPIPDYLRKNSLFQRTREVQQSPTDKSSKLINE